ncbi:MAG: HlyC/CorC family transporter [Gammaproteobacteria bacterium]|nr:HlyC/CorC family transporter [Gammaproteobacteria bacterium]MCP4091136.1 HlyC/CorC family transporter [Gammaproteobacteria bacterium]MCP4277338.1 HlyC/CorC family transporter [Gammaproteobacteria bacterium]MCP4831601.1 HlyC/CorC family transporter [Gammaproteobacteria bacterium]MCP4927824.1 HlyC/CorC family transporter [Gammaproteobacteria bacterium]
MSDDIPIGFLFGILFFLLIFSAFFSGTETALMALNHYRLKHKARSGHRGARLAEKLLKRPDRLITLILFGNNLVNFTAAALVSYLTLRIGGPAAAAAGTFIFTLVVLIFAEVTPKTLAALHPEKLAFPAAYIYYPILKVAFPLIWSINLISNALLRLFGIDPDNADKDNLTIEELRVLVDESGTLIPRKRHRMLQGILELEDMTVDDVMVPHIEIKGINLDDDWDTILSTIRNSQYTRLPIFRDSIDNVAGILDLRHLIRTEGLASFKSAQLQQLMDEPYFIPEGTSLHRQLMQFQYNKKRAALIVDEYGDIQGLVTLEDILKEIVGEFTSDTGPTHADVTTDEKNPHCYLVDASANIRSLNRMMNWHLPIDEAKTINGLILEELEDIPETGTGLQLGDYNVEILQTSDNAINLVRIRSPDPTALSD